MNRCIVIRRPLADGPWIVCVIPAAWGAQLGEQTVSWWASGWDRGAAISEACAVLPEAKFVTPVT